MDWSRRSLLTATLTGSAGGAAATPFPDKRWQRRLLVVAAPSADHPDLARMRTEAGTDAFAARDLDLVELLGSEVRVDGEVVTSPDAAALRRAYDIDDRGFAVRLVGKDGTVKLARGEAVPMAEIYAVIDAMPMRRREMRERSHSDG